MRRGTLRPDRHSHELSVEVIDLIGTRNVRVGWRFQPAVHTSGNVNCGSLTNSIKCRRHGQVDIDSRTHETTPGHGASS